MGKQVIRMVMEIHGGHADNMEAMQVWRYGGMEVWRYGGGMEVWRYGGAM